MSLKNALLSVSFLSLAFVGCAGDHAAPSGSSTDDVNAPEGQDAAARPPTGLSFYPFDTGEVTLNLGTGGAWGSPVVFLHGFPDGVEIWRPAARHFVQDHRVFAPDLRGYNLSDKPRDVGAYSMSRLVADVTAVVNQAYAETGEPVLLVAHDWGVVATYVFAHQHPELVKGIVAVNGVHPDVLRRECANNPLQRQAFYYVNLFNTPGIEFALAADNFNGVFAGMVNGQGLPVLTPAQQDAFRAVWSQPGTMTGMLSWYRANMTTDPTFATGPCFSEAVPTGVTVDAQTLVLWGERDAGLLPGNLEGLGDYISSVTVKRFPNAGHWLVYEQPNEVIAEIEEFLNQLDGH